MYKYLDCGAVRAIMGTLEAACACVDCTAALLASDVPCTRDSGAIVPFVDRGASTAGFEFIGGVKALKITSRTVRIGDGTRGQTHRAQ